MKQRTKFMVAFLCIALILTLAACKRTVSTEEVLSKYQNACETVRNAPDLTIEGTYTCNRNVAGEVYSEQFTETASYRGLGTEEVAASVKQQAMFGPYETQYAEYYSGGAAYCKTEDAAFCTKMDMQKFQNRQIAAILIDPSLYGKAQVGESSGNTTITFSEPTALETWVTDCGDAVMIDASGTVTLDGDGNLLESRYYAKFTCDTVTYDVNVSAAVKLETAQTLDEDLAALPAKCPTLTYFDAPRKILQVVGDVYTAQAMTAVHTESVYSPAYARSRSRTSTFNIYGTGEDFMAQVSYEVVNTDYSNTPVTNSETAIFRDGICTSSIDGADFIVREGITAEKMRKFCEDEVLAALFTPNYLKNAKMTEKDGQMRIEFTGNTAFADNLCNSIYSIFTANLDTYAESYTTPVAGGYLCIDKITGLPTALGIQLKRIHVKGEISYPLTYQLDQTMQLSSPEAYENITGEPEPAPTDPQ
jgi:hypothetical protein